MIGKRFVPMIAAGLWLAACSTPLPPAAPPRAMGAKTCTPGHGDCVIDVWAEVDPSGACSLRVEADHVYVQASATIVWQVKPETLRLGYVFPMYGVMINEDNPVQPQWSLRPQQSSASSVQWMDKHDSAGTYAYTVLLVKPLGGHDFAKCGPLDPWIHNE